MINRILLFVSILALVLGLATGAWATSYVGKILGTGTMAEPAGLYGTHDWSSAYLSWEVDGTTTLDHWTYTYLFTVTVKGISHVITEVSDTFVDGDVKEDPLGRKGGRG